jgi:hypothetical protein
MSVSYIPEKVKFILWGKAAGRCQYEGCNEKLYLDQTTKAEFNQAYIAHIIADKPGGPRGDDVLSEKLKRDLTNLMLLCDRHHRLVDKEDVDGHPVSRLMNMKSRHEERIRIASDISEDLSTNIILFGARIGEHGTPLTYSEAANAIKPDFLPASDRPIILSMDSAHKDDEDSYWRIQSESLKRNFETELARLKDTSETPHFSVFGLAPQPLLIQLGTLLSDITRVKVYTRLREPETWVHQEDIAPVDFHIIEPADTTGYPVLNISITAKIEDSRIQKAIQGHISIWKLTVPNPGKDLVRSDMTLMNFRNRVREIFEKIKLAHGEDATLNVFPAMPNSTAIEFGRVWQPKAELPMIIFDQNASRNGFIRTVLITKPKRTQYDY